MFYSFRSEAVIFIKVAAMIDAAETYPADADVNIRLYVRVQSLIGCAL